MATKKETIPTNVNTNNNTNNTNVNVKVDLQKPKRTPAKKKEAEKEKPNWLLKAITIALIGFALSLIAYYIQDNNSNTHNPPVIENGAPAISGEKQTN